MEAPSVYPIGSKVVHPSYGAGVVVGIEVKSIGKNSLSYYIIAMHSMEVMVPVKSAATLGLRSIGPLPSLRAALMCRCELPEKVESTQDYMARRAALGEKLKSGSFEQVASAVRVLYFLQAKRSLGSVDHQLLDRGMDILASELALASDQEIAGAKEEIEQLLAHMLQDAKQA